MLLQRHVKDPEHSAKRARGRLRLNMYTPLTQRSRSGLTIGSRHGVGTYPGNELTHKSSGNARSQSAQLAEPLWTDPGRRKGGNGACELISTLKEKPRQGIIRKIFPLILSCEGKKRP